MSHESRASGNSPPIAAVDYGLIGEIHNMDLMSDSAFRNYRFRIASNESIISED